ncbi:MAG: MCP four helix bundle domain-containing protein [Marinoscillum sp.]
MKWIYIINQKTKASFALGTIFILILMTNLADSRHASELKSSFSSFYKDRLIVEGYIYEMSSLMHEKEIIFKSELARAKSPLTERNQEINSSMNQLMKDYEETKLTESETLHFDNLKKEFARLADSEVVFGETSERSVHTQQQIILHHQKISKSLDELSGIQLSEGQNILDKSNRIFASDYITSKFEIGVLFIIGLIIQALIFSSRSFTSKFPQQSSLN